MCDGQGVATRIRIVKTRGKFAAILAGHPEFLIPARPAAACLRAGRFPERAPFAERPT
jgi:hypothetical protein